MAKESLLELGSRDSAGVERCWTWQESRLEQLARQRHMRAAPLGLVGRRDYRAAIHFRSSKLHSRGRKQFALSGKSMFICTAILAPSCVPDFVSTLADSLFQRRFHVQHPLE